MPGHNHGPSIKNPRVYEALVPKYGKKKAAQISNGLVKKGRKKKKGKGKKGGKKKRR